MKTNIRYKTDFITIKLAFTYYLTFFWKQTLFLPSKSVVTTLTVLLSIDLEPKKNPRGQFSHAEKQP